MIEIKLNGKNDNRWSYAAVFREKASTTHDIMFGEPDCWIFEKFLTILFNIFMSFLNISLASLKKL